VAIAHNNARKKPHHLCAWKACAPGLFFLIASSLWPTTVRAQATPIQAMAQCQQYMSSQVAPGATMYDACTPYQPNDGSLGAYLLYFLPPWIGSTPSIFVFRYGSAPSAPCTTSATNTCGTAPRQPDKSRNPGCHQCRPSVNDPVDIADGYMWREESDVDFTAGPPLLRNYNSQAIPLGNKFAYPAGSFGAGWRNNYSRHIYYTSAISTATASVARANGQMLYFTKSTQGWTPDPDIHSRLTEIDSAGALSGWEYFDQDSGDNESYDLSGRLIAIRQRNGRSLALAYDTNDQLLAKEGFIVVRLNPSYGCSLVCICRNLDVQDDFSFEALNQSKQG
jgi:YD repeat-containing protein